MSDLPTSPTPPWRRQTRQFADELVQLLQLRKDLAEKELLHDRKLIGWSLRVGGTGIFLTVVGLPLLLNAGASGLGAVTQMSSLEWNLILGGLLIFPGLLFLTRAIRRLRSDFNGLHHSLAEVSEDLVWLREWVERSDTEQLADEPDGDRDS